jgi:membrane fusion protein, multidrug efflux system
MTLKKYKIFLCTVLLLSGCKKEEIKIEERVLPVSVEEVSQQNVPVFFNTFGHLISPQSVEIRPQVNGIIKERFFQESQHVKQGDPLYLIDPQPYQFALDKAKASLLQAEANLQFAKEKLQRYSELIKKDFVSKLIINEYERDVKVQETMVLNNQAEVGIAQQNLGYCTITSPIDGQVGLSKIDPGNLVVANENQSIVQVQQIAPIDVEFTVPQNEFIILQKIANIREHALKIRLSNEETSYEGKIIAFNNEVDLSTGTIKIRGRFENLQLQLWPGEFVLINLFLRTKENALVIPADALQFGEKGTFVYVLKADMTVHPVFIHVSDRIDNKIVVDDGLKTGEKVVTDGQLNLLPGSKVMVVPPVEKLQ